MLEERDLADLRGTAKRMALPPSVYARSLLLRSLREEMQRISGDGRTDRNEGDGK